MKTTHLELGQLGFVWLHSMDDAFLFGDQDCGFIDRPYWPQRLGQEPDWFERELGQLQKFWDEEQDWRSRSVWPTPSYESDRKEMMSW